MKGVENLSMSLLRYLSKVKVLLTTEETGIREKPTAGANRGTRTSSG